MQQVLGGGGQTSQAKSILKAWAGGWGPSCQRLLPVPAAAGPGLEEGGVRKIALASFCGRGEGNSNQEALRAQGSGVRQTGAEPERRDLGAPAPCAWQSPRGTPPAAGSGEPGAEANSPLENQTENSPPGAGRALGGGGACLLPPRTSWVWGQRPPIPT